MFRFDIKSRTTQGLLAFVGGLLLMAVIINYTDLLNIYQMLLAFILAAPVYWGFKQMW